jgi:uncharacterized phage-associated protein
MPNRTEIVETIQQGTAQVLRTFGSLSDEQLRTAVHAGEGGWTEASEIRIRDGRKPVGRVSCP